VTRHRIGPSAHGPCHATVYGIVQFSFELIARALSLSLSRARSLPRTLAWDGTNITPISSLPLSLPLPFPPSRPLSPSPSLPPSLPLSLPPFLFLSLSISLSLSHTRIHAHRRTAPFPPSSSPAAHLSPSLLLSPSLTLTCTHTHDELYRVHVHGIYIPSRRRCLMVVVLVDVLARIL
jgi:hypothetical protein